MAFLVAMYRYFVFVLSIFLYLSPTNAQSTSGIIHTTPDDNVNGSFVVPRQWPTTFTIGAVVNVSWTTKFPSVNLFYYQNGHVVDSIQLAVNLAEDWFQWTVATGTTNLTDPFVFRIVNAQGTSYDQTNLGFWSSGFYIQRDPSATTTSSLTTSSRTTSTSARSSSTSITSSTTTTSAAEVSSTPTGSSGASSSGTPNNSGGNADPGLSDGAKIGIGVGVGLGAIALVGGALAFYFFRKRRNGREPVPTAPPATEYYDDPNKYNYAGQPFPQQPQEMDSTPMRPVELPGNGQKP